MKGPGLNLAFSSKSMTVLDKTGYKYVYKISTGIGLKSVQEACQVQIYREPTDPLGAVISGSKPM